MSTALDLTLVGGVHFAERARCEQLFGGAQNFCRFVSGEGLEVRTPGHCRRSGLTNADV
jgi:hypothetical protein